MVNRVLDHCSSRKGWEDVIDICSGLQKSIETKVHSDKDTDSTVPVTGHVYLLKHGKTYKIGCSKDASQRYKQIRVQMPYKTEEVHVIETDDPSGIEAYWHNRFKDRRLEGEWFNLSASDVKAFKKRKFM